jgi:hypothetical protein
MIETPSAGILDRITVSIGAADRALFATKQGGRDRSRPRRSSRPRRGSSREPVRRHRASLTSRRDRHHINDESARQHAPCAIVFRRANA